jgi:hypothetical protein
MSRVLPRGRVREGAPIGRLREGCHLVALSVRSVDADMLTWTREGLPAERFSTDLTLSTASSRDKERWSKSPRVCRGFP